MGKTSDKTSDRDRADTNEAREHKAHEHKYTVDLKWTGNLGEGTPSYRGYSRDHEISVGSREPIRGSGDPAFRGDATRYNPEELLLAAISACHMLWYLHLCAVAHVCVVAYSDEASGTMTVAEPNPGRFSEAVIRPQVVIAPDPDGARTSKLKAIELHNEAHRLCFIANSVNFPVRVDATVEIEVASSS